MKYVTVFCASHEGNDPALVQAAVQLGKSLAQRGLGLVYGGTNIGLMRVMADSVLAEGGQVVGIIPSQFEEKRFAHQGLTELVTVHSIDERKTQLIARAQAIIAFPGSWGTMEELFAALVQRMLGYINTPIGLLNINGYYDPLLAQFQQMVSKGMMEPRTAALLQVASSGDDLLDALFA